MGAQCLLASASCIGPSSGEERPPQDDKAWLSHVPSLRGTRFPLFGLTPDLRPGLLYARPLRLRSGQALRGWGGVVWAASFPHATSPQIFVPAPNPQGAQANYIGPSSGKERPPQDDNVLCGNGGGPGLAFVGFVPVEALAVAMAAAGEELEFFDPLLGVIRATPAVGE